MERDKEKREKIEKIHDVGEFILFCLFIEIWIFLTMYACLILECKRLIMKIYSFIYILDIKDIYFFMYSIADNIFG